MKKMVSVIGGTLFVVLLFQMTVFASSPNYGYWNLEYSDPVNEIGDAHGYVQCQPSYLQGDYHAARGWLKVGSKKYYTATGLSKFDSKIYADGRTLHFEGDPPILYWGHDWVHKDSNIWPQ